MSYGTSGDVKLFGALGAITGFDLRVGIEIERMRLDLLTFCTSQDCSVELRIYYARFSNSRYMEPIPKPGRLASVAATMSAPL